MLSVCYPRQVILITSRHNDKDNVMAADWHMPCSFSPELYAVAIGKTRYTLKLIEASGVFGINFIPKSMEDTARNVGRVSGITKDKFKLFNIEKEDASRIDCPMIKQAVGQLECKMVHKIDAGDHFILISEVLHTTSKNYDKRLFHMQVGDVFTTTVD